MGDVKIAVIGAGGRMGRELLRAIAAAPGCVISVAPNARARRWSAPTLVCLQAALR